MTVSLLPGVRERLYISGWRLENKPSILSPTIEEAKSSQRLADSGLFTSYAMLWPGCPTRITKRAWSLKFDAPTPSDLLRLRMLASGPGRYDFCPWLPELEHFARPLGALGTPTPCRRHPDEVVAPGLIPGSTSPAGFIGETTGDWYAVAWGAADSGYPWRQTFTIPTMTTEEPGWLAYFPVYRVEVQPSEIGFGVAEQEQHTIRLTEV